MVVVEANETKYKGMRGGEQAEYWPKQLLTAVVFYMATSVGILYCQLQMLTNRYISVQLC